MQAGQRLPVELWIYWTCINVQNMWAWVDAGARCALINGSPQEHKRQWEAADGNGGREVEAKRLYLS